MAIRALDAPLLVVRDLASPRPRFHSAALPSQNFAQTLVSCKSASAQEMRALLTARKQQEKKMLGTELGFRGVLRGFGLRVGKTSRGRFARRVQALAHGNPGARAGESGNAVRTRRCRRR